MTVTLTIEEYRSLQCRAELTAEELQKRKDVLKKAAFDFIRTVGGARSTHGIEEAVDTWVGTVNHLFDVNPDL